MRALPWLFLLLPALPVPGLGQRARAQGSPEHLERAKVKLAEAQAEVDAAIQAQQAAPGPEDDLAGRVDVLSADVDELVRVQERLAGRAKADRLAWSAAYRVAMNNVAVQGPTGDDFNGSLWNHRLRLSVDAERGPLRLHGRLAMYKTFGEAWEGPVGSDARSTRIPRDTTLRVERLYLDWFINDRVALTLGRVASPGGPPAELKEFTDRQATWGLQMVEAEFETLMLTVSLSQIREGTSLRFFYSPFFRHAPYDPLEDDSLFQNVGIKPTHIWGLLAETTLPGLGKDSLVQLGLVNLPAFRPEPLPLRTPDGDLLPTKLPDSLGSYLMVNGLVQANQLGGAVDLFLAGSLTRYGPDGAMVYPGEVRLGLATADQADHLAFMVFGGGRWTLPIGEALAPRLGAEVNYGSQHHSHWGSPSELLVTKLATRGLAVEAYWLQPLHEALFLRVGVLHLARDWRGSFIGPAVRADDAVTNGYALLNARF
ncbi:MAG: DUF3373 family protein [Myxococcales bacterium]|nr:DUF3373 family protein [Myxococcales bacterium]